MRFVAPFAAPLLGALVVVAAAAPPASVAPIADSFVMTIGGAPFGGEESTRASTAEGVTLSGKVHLKLPGAGDGTLKQDATLASDGTPRAYSLDIDVPGQQFVLKVSANDQGYALSITPRGATEPVKTQDVAVKRPVFLLDNSVVSHLDVLTRSMRDLEVGQNRAITALVPQALQAYPGTIERTADGTGTLSGASIPTRTYVVTIAMVREELVARGTDGALLRVSVSTQGFVASRKGFETAKTPAPAVDPDADSRESSVDVKSSVGALPAALLMPKAQGLVPGVVFLSGSGPNDHDETIGPNKPFRDLARGLGDRGIASLRVDKRTHAIKDRTKLQNVRLADEYLDDAAIALAQLRAVDGVDPKRIFVLGHSEGAMVAPKVAAANPGTRGIVMMAPGVRPIDAMVIDQMAFGAKLTGRSEEEIAEQTKELQTTFAAIRSSTTDAPSFMGASATYWREVIDLNVAQQVRASALPILVAQGEKDIQVRKDADFDLLQKEAGTDGGRVTYRSFPGLNHLFMKVERESTGAEYGIPGHVDPAVVNAVADWILAH